MQVRALLSKAPKDHLGQPLLIKTLGDKQWVSYKYFHLFSSTIYQWFLCQDICRSNNKLFTYFPSGQSRRNQLTAQSGVYTAPFNVVEKIRCYCPILWLVWQGKGLHFISCKFSLCNELCQHFISHLRLFWINKTMHITLLV